MSTDLITEANYELISATSGQSGSDDTVNKKAILQDVSICTNIIFYYVFHYITRYCTKGICFSTTLVYSVLPMNFSNQN